VNKSSNAVYEQAGFYCIHSRVSKIAGRIYTHEEVQSVIICFRKKCIQNFEADGNIKGKKTTFGIGKTLLIKMTAKS
jgi:hypothetical protein